MTLFQKQSVSQKKKHVLFPSNHPKFFYCFNTVIEMTDYMAYPAYILLFYYKFRISVIYEMKFGNSTAIEC